MAFHVLGSLHTSHHHQPGQHEAALLRRPAFCCRFWRTLAVAMRGRPILILFAAAAVAVSAAALLPAADDADPSSVERVTVIPPGMVWFLVIAPDGSAAMQYGSTFGDSARVPPGTIDFRAVVAEVVRQRTSDRVAGGTQASLESRGETSTRISSLKDDRFFRDLVTSLDQQWESKGWRFDDLRRSHPIYPAARDR